jgi:hypothetical protein
MSLGFDAAFPLGVRLLGGHQTARSLHFLVTILLVLFLLIHVVMIFVAGFRVRMRAMISGRAAYAGTTLSAVLSKVEAPTVSGAESAGGRAKLD